MRIPAPLASSRWARTRWLVLAPHPDDETLGAGALIAEASRQGRLAAVAYLTDGEGSHPSGGRSLAAARRAEAELAVRRLTSCRPHIQWLGWPDSHPLAPIDPEYVQSSRRLAAMLRRERIGAVAVTARNEPHCDHSAAYQLAVAAAETAARGIKVFEYLVWASCAPARVRALRTATAQPSLRRHALAAHRSQTTPRYGLGFRLPATLLRRSHFDILYVDEAPN